MEDRIVGPLSPIQFGIVVIGGGISFYVLQAPYIPPPLNTGGAIIGAILTLTLAIGKFNDQPMYRFIRFFISFIVRPRVRIWHKQGGEVILIKPGVDTKAEKKAHPPKQVSKNDIARLATVLDSRGTVGVAPKIEQQK